MLCVDDCSTDKSYDILSNYAAKYNNIRVFKTASSGSGPSRARNIGLENAVGKYFWFVDSDDSIVKDSLLRIKELIIQEQPELIRISKRTMDDEESENESLSELQWEYEKSAPLSYTYSGIVSKELTKKCWNNGKFVETVFFGEDMLFWLTVFCQQTSETLFLKNIAYNYRTSRPGSLMHSIKSSENSSSHQKRFDSMLTVVKIIREFSPTLEKEKQVYAYKMMNDYIDGCIWPLSHSPYNLSKKLKSMVYDGIIDKNQYKVNLKAARKYRLIGKVNNSKFLSFLNNLRHNIGDIIHKIKA